MHLSCDGAGKKNQRRSGLESRLKMVIKRLCADKCDVCEVEIIWDELHEGYRRLNGVVVLRIVDAGHGRQAAHCKKCDPKAFYGYGPTKRV